MSIAIAVPCPQTETVQTIAPMGDDWSSIVVLSRMVDHFNGRMRDPKIVMQSHYDHENYDYVLKLLKSNLDLKVIGNELECRAKNHTTYFDGDAHYKDIRKSITKIYNSLAGIVGKRRSNPFFESDEKNHGYVMRLMDSNMNTTVVGKEISMRAYEQLEEKSGVDCGAIRKEVIGVYNYLSQSFGRESNLTKDACDICYNCVFPGYFMG